MNVRAFGISGDRGSRYRGGLLALAVYAAVLATPAAAAGQAEPSPAPSASPVPASSPTSQPPTTLNPERVSLHFQVTNTQQYHGAFPAAYSGPQSLTNSPDTAKTLSATIFAGQRLWTGAEAYADLELDQGFGFDGTFGAAGFPNGEAYKVGAGKYYERVHRYFIRQTFRLGGEVEQIDPDQNQLGGSQTADHLTLSVGKYNVTDIFDTNTYAHDPRNDFLNWALIDAGAFDYAADAWGFTYGLTAELTQGASSFRAGTFQLSEIPNTTVIEHIPFRQYQLVTEFERRTSFFGGHSGSVKALAYGSNAYMAPLADVTSYAIATGTTPNPALFRTDRHWKLGGEINLAQEVAPHVGVFSRLSAANGSYETYEFSEIDRSISCGLSVDGGLFGRPHDTFGLAGVQNALSLAHQQYLADGGLGILIGDGRLSYRQERILEAYYKLALVKGLSVKADFQRIVNPAYNSVRGPVSIYGLQFHYEI